MPMPLYHTLLFDLDGTLLDTLTDLANAVNTTLRLHGYPQHPISAIRRFVGNGVGQLMRRALPPNTDEAVFAQALAAFKEYYAAHNCEQTRPYEGILPMLAELSAAGCQLAVVSNKNDENVQALCQLFFSDTVRLAVGDREGLRRKPAPDSVRYALSQLHAQPQAALYIGDSDVDIQTAQAAGLPCLSVTWGFRGEDELKQAGATLFAHTPAQVVSLILRSGNPG